MAVTTRFEPQGNYDVSDNGGIEFFASIAYRPAIMLTPFHFSACTSFSRVIFLLMIELELSPVRLLVIVVGGLENGASAREVGDVERSPLIFIALILSA